MKCDFKSVFEGRKVLVTGHTGFKGSWLSLWLQMLGAKVVGYSLPAPTEPNNYELSQVAQGMSDIVGDVRDYPALKKTMDKHQPEIVFHMAAQPIVLHGYTDPKETFDVNAGGTVNVLEAVRHCHSVKAAVIVTTDKCYENKGWLWGYRENDALGGNDPYSASKSMSELVVASYNASFFKGTDKAAVASVRAGNVIGGGDFSDFRIVPDCMRALMSDQPIEVRHPNSVRPWLNVLDPLYGYLTLALRLYVNGLAYSGAWNFGPCERESVDVKMLVEKAIELWGKGDWADKSLAQREAPAEMALLRLNWDKAANLLKWRPIYDWKEALHQTVDWFKAYHEGAWKTADGGMRDVCSDHIEAYMSKLESSQCLFV